MLSLTMRGILVYGLNGCLVTQKCLSPIPKQPLSSGVLECIFQQIRLFPPLWMCMKKVTFLSCSHCHK